MTQFKEDGEQQLDVSEMSESEASEASLNHVDESKLSEISEHESIRQFPKNGGGESQTAKKPSKQSVPGRSRPRKRSPDSHDFRGGGRKKPRQSAETALIPFKDLGRIPENTIQPQDLYRELAERLGSAHPITLRFLTRLFFAVASPDAFADLREACSSAREQGVFTAPQHTHTVEDTVKAIDALDSAAFANRILRRNYLALLVEHRHERETHHRSEPKNRTLRSAQHNSQQSDSVQKQYGFGRPSSMALIDLMVNAYPNLEPPLRQRDAEGTEYKKKLKALKNKLESGHNWQLLKQRFSAGILALVPTGREYEIQNSE